MIREFINIPIKNIVKKYLPELAFTALFINIYDE